MTRTFLSALTLSLGFAAGCSPGAESPNRTPLAEKWYTRAQNSYKIGDFEDATIASQSALEASPSDNDIRLMSARLALTRLEFGKAAKLTEGIPSAEALSIRGRALWYAGDIDAAADALETLLRDPAVKDPWARQIATLARSGGTSRKPFTIDGGMVAAVEMPEAGPAMVVPCELNGEHILALVATASSEVVLDSNARKEPAWVSLRFGDRLEVTDVPAITQDLSAISRQLGGTINALLGVNLLRHLHATIDRRGDQFVVRKATPPAPPDAIRMPLWYVRGGGLLMRASLSAKDDAFGAYLVDSAFPFPLSLSDAAWKKAGVDIGKLQADPQLPNMRTGPVPMLRLGSFDLPGVPAVQGAPTSTVQQSLDVDLDGVVGSGLIAEFRVTFADEGRFAWLEPDPMTIAPGGRPPPGATSPAPGGAMPAPLPPVGGPATTPEKAPEKTPGKGSKPTKPETAPKPGATPEKTPAPAAKKGATDKPAPEKAPEKKP